MFIEKEENIKKRIILDCMLTLEYVDGIGMGSQKGEV